MKPVPDGLILLHKQPGITSFDSLRDIKRQLGSGKAGHTGTLDKFAEGLLLVLTGKALKLSRWFTHCDKQYEGTILFGTETETLDPEGAVIATAPLPTRQAVEQSLAQFRGAIMQAPPAYSALHIDGERASVLARRGEAPEMQKRPIHIHRLELLSWDPPHARIYVHCSAGTYIRSLARDIALAANSRAHLSTLLRTHVAGFELGTKVLRSNAEGEEDQTVLPLFPITKDVFAALGIPCLDISPQDAQKAIHGKPLAQILHNSLPLPDAQSNTLALFSENELIAVIEKAKTTDPSEPHWTYGYVYARN